MQALFWILVLLADNRTYIKWGIYLKNPKKKILFTICVIGLAYHVYDRKYKNNFLNKI